MKNKFTLPLFAAMLTGLFATVLVAQTVPVTPAPEGAKVSILSPADGETVEREFVVVFGLEGMGVAPAGIDVEGTGHHHLLVDQDSLPPEGLPMGSPPIHFGKGQTQTTLTLEPGTHTLQLIMGDKLHVPHNPPIVSELITIEVKE